MNHTYFLTLSWEGLDKLSKLKDSLLPCLNENSSWVIKDNGSKDDTVKVAETWGPKVKVFAYPDNNQNFSQGMNYLFHQINPKDNDNIVLLNNDVTVKDSHSFKNMISLLDKDSSIGVVGARILYPNTEKIQHAGVVFFEKRNGPHHWMSKESSNNSAMKNREFQAVTAAVCALKASSFKMICTTNKSNLCGMDEKFHWAFDDIDMCLSLKYKHNKKIVYCGNTGFYHEESATLKINPANKLFMSHNIGLLRSKWQHHYKFDSMDYRDKNHNLYKRK